NSESPQDSSVMISYDLVQKAMRKQ
ncbi:hypothetical protein DBR06_SOUSAS4910008, partial [Sousa chinensis]